MGRFTSSLWHFFCFGFAWFLLGLIVLMAWGCPHYHVWQQGLVGEAELRRAEQNRKIVVQEAEAKKEAARSLAEAEIERAKGVAESNKIIGTSLQGNEDYLRYLWVSSMNDKESPTVIYIPTEAGLPILEAGKRQPKPR